ncbi:MAG: hypothetical protein N2689_17805, partial [Verrucomicrobiae bacterium]|nr:hypothetical protein [Verrucomicrobiae bacterium]
EKPRLDQEAALRGWMHEFLRTLRIYHGIETPLGRGWYPRLRVWLWDNAPVFRYYGWRWRAVHAAVATRFNLHPSDECALKDLAKDMGLRLGLKLGRAPSANRDTQACAELLTPQPQIKLPASK